MVYPSDLRFVRVQRTSCSPCFVRGGLAFAFLIRCGATCRGCRRRAGAAPFQERNAMQNVVGLFENSAQVESVMNRLKAHGIAPEAVGIAMRHDHEANNLID